MANREYDLTWLKRAIGFLEDGLKLKHLFLEEELLF